MSSNIVHSQFGLTQPNMTEEPSLDQYNKRASSQSFSSSASESSTVSNTQPETQQPQQPQPQQKQSITQPSHPPSRTKKLVDKFATFSPRTMKNKSDRQLIVETAYSNRNSKKDNTQPPSKPAEGSVKHSKKKKRAPINITEGMSRADIFAANVASAVDAAEDAEEEEDYIYSTSHSRTSSVTSLTSPQSQAIPCPHMPSDNNYGYPYNMPSYMYGTIHRSCSYLYRPPFNGGYYNNNNNNNNNTSGSETDEVISNQLNRGGSQNNMISPNKPTGVMRSSLPDMSQYVFHKKRYPNYGPANFPYNSYSYWYDEERLPLFAKWRPSDYETRQRQSCAPKISSLTVIVVFLLASSYLIYFATTRPLAEVSITGITNVLAADKELMFNIHVKGRNSGLLNIEIVNANLNVFATPVKRNEILDGPGGQDDVISGPINEEATPSEFLGNILSFDEPLVFVAGINGTGVISEPSGQVRLRNPGGENDKEGQDRWSYIIRRQYDLTVRGFLEYNLPFSTNRVTVCFATRVDNASGGGVENGDNNDNNDTNTKDTISDTLGACGDWDQEQNKKDE